MDDRETYIYGIWFVGDGKTGDWMARLVIEGGVWVIKYRFRYYSAESKDPFDGEDKKNWYGFRAQDASDESRDKAVESINEVMFPIIQLRYGSRGDFVLLDCKTSDIETLERKLAGREWVHMVKVEVDK